MNQWAGNGEDWVSTANRLPPENVQLDTISDGGIQQTLIYSKGLWWHTNMSMYVYYVPRRWRRVAARFNNGGY